MYTPRIKHGTVKCVPRYINGNRAGPLIDVHTRSRAPTGVLLHEGRPGFYAGGERGVPGGEYRILNIEY
jgi:hypothetical protein